LEVAFPFALVNTIEDVVELRVKENSTDWTTERDVEYTLVRFVEFDVLATLIVTVSVISGARTT